ncbi:MAG: LysE family translocator [Pseudomonadota bacterium]
METLTLAHLLAFNAALFLAVAAPGPAFLVCVQASLTGGRREGVVTGIGLGVMAGLWTLAALLGLDALFALFPYAYTGLKVAGALVVLLIAVQVWRGARDPVDQAVPSSTRRAFLRGFVLNLGNPKSILFAAGVLLVIFPPGLSAAEMALITVNHVALEVAVYSTLAHLMSRDRVRVRYLAARPTIARAMAVVLGGLGLNLLASSA